MRTALFGSLGLLVLVAACGGGGGAARGNDVPDAGSGGNSLSGSMAFSVAEALLDTQLPASECGVAGQLRDGSYASFMVLLSEVGSLCGRDGGPYPSSGHALWIQVASPTYRWAGGPFDGGPITPITPGDYPIVYEAEDDEDVCMGGPVGTAKGSILEVFDLLPPDSGADPATGIGYSGTVTFTTVDPGHVAGHFDVMVAPVTNAGYDTQHLVPLSGTFDVSPCPLGAGK